MQEFKFKIYLCATPFKVNEDEMNDYYFEHVRFRLTMNRFGNA